VEAIVRRLLLLLQLDAAHKVIVFSSWLDVLDILSHALTANGIHHAFGRGRKGFLQALEQFKGCAVAAAEVAAEGAAGLRDEAAGGLGSTRGLDSMRGMAQQEVQQGGKRQQGGDGDFTRDGVEQIEIDLEDVDDAAEAAAEEEGSREGTEAAAGAAEAEEIRAAGPSARLAAATAAASAAGAGVACRRRPRVLLMLVAHGAAGLNLTEAQHVVLIEPLLDPAQELQATGRISRFGQTATTHVHRWVLTM
jgi:E3 ubiquitin-protein ligase SHPRH